VDAATEEGSIGFEKNEATTPRDGANKMAYPSVVQRFATANPDDRCPICDEFLHFLARNGRIRTGVKNCSGVHTMKQRAFPRRTKDLRDSDPCQFCHEPRW
jgi:hypothetical protein